MKHCPISVSYNMNETLLDRVNTHKHLGVTLSCNLDWGTHIDEVTSKSQRLLGFIRRTIGSNDPDTLKKLYSALIRPILEYCAPVWAPYKGIHRQKLEGLQKRFTRYCFPGPWHSRPSYTNRLQTLDIPSVISRFNYLCIITTGILL